MSARQQLTASAVIEMESRFCCSPLDLFLIIIRLLAGKIVILKKKLEKFSIQTSNAASLSEIILSIR
jgi:hypothetical protein